jgi:1-deoxy-D-xylulose-5-phosphate reductoisomerase
VALARHCGEIGGELPAIFNAANEVAVQAFIDGEIAFTAIIELVASAVNALEPTAKSALRDLADVSAVEDNARRTARELLKKG